MAVGVHVYEYMNQVDDLYYIVANQTTIYEGVIFAISAFNASMSSFFTWPFSNDSNFVCNSSIVMTLNL